MRTFHNLGDIWSAVVATVARAVPGVAAVGEATAEAAAGMEVKVGARTVRVV